MYKITEKVALNPTVTKMVIEAPLIAKKAKPGQFIIVRPFEDSERIPLTVAGYDREAGTVEIIFQIVGGTTMELNSLNVGDSVHDFVGPLGRATEVEGLKKVCVVGAFFKIPFALAAISLQFLFTAMAGILLGAGYGALSQLVYVLIGLVGVPIFALGGGFSYVLQPTFGFLLGLIPSAFVIGKLAKRPLTFWRTALAMLAGLAVLYAVGVPYLALIANAYLGKGLTFWQVLKNGMLIYLPGDLLKIAFGSFLCVAITRRLPQLFAAPQAE